MEISLKIVFLVSFLCSGRADQSKNLPKCEFSEENCEQFSFERFQRNSSNASTSSETKALKVDLVHDFAAVENRILFDKMEIKEDGNSSRKSAQK